MWTVCPAQYIFEVTSQTGTLCQGSIRPGALIKPCEELPQRYAPMAVPRFLLRRQFCERFLNWREVEQRIVTKASTSARFVENDAFGLAANSRQSRSIARGYNHANEPSCPLLPRNAC